MQTTVPAAGPQPSRSGANRYARAGWFPYPLFFFLYAMFAIYFYFAVVEPYLASSDLYATRILADAITYESICVSESNYLDWATLRDIGPCIGLRVFGYNSAILSIFNAALIVFAITRLCSAYGKPWRPFLTLVLINPITFLSIFGPNKEVFGLTAFAMLAIFVRTRSKIALAVCLIMALFTRLPVFIIVSVYCIVSTFVLPRFHQIDSSAIRKYVMMMLAMAASVSVLAALFGEELQYSLLGDFSRVEEISQATSIALSLDYLSSAGLYVINYAIRMLLNLYSGVFGVSYLFTSGIWDYYSVGVAGSSFLFIAMTYILVRRKVPLDMRRNSASWNMFVFIALFTLVICLSPAIQHRYFFPIYVIILLFVIDRPEEPARTLSAARMKVASRHSSENQP